MKRVGSIKFRMSVCLQKCSSSKYFVFVFYSVEYRLKIYCFLFYCKLHFTQLLKKSGLYVLSALCISYMYLAPWIQVNCYVISLCTAHDNDNKNGLDLTCFPSQVHGKEDYSKEHLEICHFVDNLQNYNETQPPGPKNIWKVCKRKRLLSFNHKRMCYWYRALHQGSTVRWDKNRAVYQ